MFKRIIGGALLTCLVALSAPALAVPITGEVFTDGRFFTDTGDLASATYLDFRRAWTTSGNGAYSAVNGNRREVSYTNFTFNPGLASPVEPLWTFSVGSDVYSFVMHSVSITTQTASQLTLIGVGMLYITGYDATPGIWEFSTLNVCGNTACTGRFKFTAESSVPEPGTLALLGLGLLGLSLARRRHA